MNLDSSTAEAVNYALIDHISEVTNIPAAFEFTNCMSGLTVDKTEGTCTLGYITSVAQITLNDIKDLLPYKAPITPI